METLWFMNNMSLKDFGVLARTVANMAATQAENQPNEVNSDPVPRDHPTDLNNSGLQNGTEKNGGRGSIGSDSATVNAKAKSPGQGSHPEMSQYRPEHSSASTLPNNEPHANSVDNAGKIHDGKAQYIHPNDPGSIGQGDPNYKVPDGGPPMQGYYGRGGYHHAPSEPLNPGAPQVNSNDSNVNPISQYNQYNSPQMRHAYSGGGKGMSMVTPRPPTAASNYGPGPQRFLSGPSISQQTGPTPTLNQLLQSNQPQHYQNSYGDYTMKDQSYQQWGPQRPPTNYNPQGPGPTPYRNQHPVSTYLHKSAAVSDECIASAMNGAPVCVILFPSHPNLGIWCLGIGNRLFVLLPS
ncbi:UNVERIFIED_CONTAM: hypothetical protein PYX00_004095 [Menopon gallinae]|uniref:Uncharacterized protein n=1 Tax=Menopon gallinae TaxID=328185 RepID=A0AAW2I2V1_9NEOP